MVKTTLVDMNKWDSLVFLREHGLNTPNSALFIPSSLKEKKTLGDTFGITNDTERSNMLFHKGNTGDNTKDLKEELKSAMGRIISSEKRISIRTFKLPLGSSFKDVFFPNVLIDDSLIEKLIPLLFGGYFLILSSPIDPQDCLLRGCIHYRGKNFFERSQFLIEYLEGPGTVRDLEHAEGKKIKSLEVGFHPGDWTPLREAFGLIGLLLLSNADRIVSVLSQESKWEFILEWSIYKKPVGIKKECLIFWHLR